MRRIPGIIVTLLVLVSVCAGPSEADVYGDDGQDRYVGTGGLILPGSVDSSTRRRVAGCAGCHWRLASPCVAAPPPPGTLMPGQVPQSTCMSVVRGCPGGAQLLRTWFQPTGGSWTDLGLICLADGGPSTIDDLAGRVRDRFVADLPELRPTSQPDTGVLAQVPVVFGSGQSRDGFTGSYSLLGEEVTVRATARWTWRFGDGGHLVTDAPGGAYPDMSVAHPYRRPGRFDVDVSAAWSARFTVMGLGEFPVDETVRQEAVAVVHVGEGRAVLAVR